MTEAEWLACEEPEKMLAFLGESASERKLKLFACACCRRVWHLFAEEKSRKAVELTERGADGLVSQAELEHEDFYSDEMDELEHAAHAAWSNLFLSAAEAARHTSGAAARAVKAAVWQAATGPGVLAEAAAAAAEAEEQKAQCNLLRDVFGNPFRAVNIDPAWLAWGNGAVRHIAEANYEERSFDRLPILGDALEDAGCDNADILAHCRDPGPHVRGCWVLDLLLDKE